MHDSPESASWRFSLKPGERITSCSPLWTSGSSDRILEEIAYCNHCTGPTYRVFVVTTAAGLERRESLCARHFAEAAKNVPGLQQEQELKA